MDPIEDFRLSKKVNAAILAESRDTNKAKILGCGVDTIEDFHIYYTYYTIYTYHIYYTNYTYYIYYT